MIRKTILLLFGLALSLALCCCGTTEQKNEAVESSPAAEVSAEIDKETLQGIERAIKESTAEDIMVYVTGNDGAVQIDVSINPIILNYQFAMILDPVVEATKAEIDARDVPLSKFRVSGLFFKDGAASHVITWDTTDLETGDFVATKDNYAKKGASLDDIFAFCEYQK